MSFDYLFEALKAHARARGMTYKDIAQALEVSEGTVNRNADLFRRHTAPAA